MSLVYTELLCFLKDRLLQRTSLTHWAADKTTKTKKKNRLNIRILTTGAEVNLLLPADRNLLFEFITYIKINSTTATLILFSSSFHIIHFILFSDVFKIHSHIHIHVTRVSKQLSTNICYVKTL